MYIEWVNEIINGTREGLIFAITDGIIPIMKENCSYILMGLGIIGMNFIIKIANRKWRDLK